MLLYLIYFLYIYNLIKLWVLIINQCKNMLIQVFILACIVNITLLLIKSFKNENIKVKLKYIIIHTLYGIIVTFTLFL